MAFVNTITTNDGTVYDVQDKRLEVTAADAGKMVSVDENGNLSLVIPSSGTKLYRHDININNSYRSTLVIISTNSNQLKVGTSIKMGSYILTIYYRNSDMLLTSVLSMPEGECSGVTAAGTGVTIIEENPGVTSWVDTITEL